MGALDHQVGGSHYVGRAIQPVEFWKANLLGGCESSIVKYLTRWRDKGGVEDLRKARHFLEIIREDKDYQQYMTDVRLAYPILAPRCLVPREYNDANRIPEPEREIIQRIWIWNCIPDVYQLDQAARLLDELIEASWVG